MIYSADEDEQEIRAVQGRSLFSLKREFFGLLFGPIASNMLAVSRIFSKRKQDEYEYWQRNDLFSRFLSLN